MHIEATQEANRFIREGGGSLFVWLKPVSMRGAWTTLDVTTRKPSRSDVAFECVDAGGFEFCLQDGLARPERVAISLTRWPRRRVKVRGFRDRGDAGWAGGGNGDADDDSDGVVWWDGGDGGGGGGNGGGGNGG